MVTVKDNNKGAAKLPPPTEGIDVEQRRRLLEMDSTCRVTRWLVGRGAAGPSCYGKALTNQRWCEKEVIRNIKNGRWACVKTAGEMVAVFVSSLRFERMEVMGASFELLAGELTCRDGGRS